VTGTVESMTDMLAERIKELIESRQATALDGSESALRITLASAVAIVVETEAHSTQLAKQSVTNQTYGVRFADDTLAYCTETTVHGSAYTDTSWTDPAFYEEDLTPKQTGQHLTFDGAMLASWDGSERSAIEGKPDPGVLRRLAEAVGLADEEPSSSQKAAGWSHRLLEAVGLPHTRKAMIALCNEVLFPALSSMPPPETSERLASVFLVGNGRTARVTEALWAWYEREADRAGAAATQIEAGRDSDAAMDSGGAAFVQIEGPASSHRDALTAKIQKAERLLADGDGDGADALLETVENTLTQLRAESS
jgi:hypothetical protein